MIRQRNSGISLLVVNISTGIKNKKPIDKDSKMIIFADRN
jgi:hypothetical protein